MRQHYSLSPVRKRLLQHGDVNIVLWYGNVHEHRDRPVLYNRSHRSRESRRHGDDLVAALYRPFAQQRRSQRHERRKVRTGAGIDQRAVLCPEVLAELFLELVGIPSGGQPELQGAVNEIAHFLRVVHSGSIRYSVALCEFLFIVMIFSAVLVHHLQYLLASLLFSHIFKHRITLYIP